MRMKPIYQLFMGAFNKTAKISHHGVILKSILIFIQSRYCKNATKFERILHFFGIVMSLQSVRFFSSLCGLLRISEHHASVSVEISFILDLLGTFHIYKYLVIRQRAENKKRMTHHFILSRFNA